MKSGTYTESGIFVPTMQLPHIDGKRHKTKPRFACIHAVTEPDGSVAWQDDEWCYNATHDQGENAMGELWLREQANVPKYLGLLNDSVVAETDGTMAAVTEAQPPTTQNYNRFLFVAATWANNGLIGGDYRWSYPEVSFGAFTIATTMTHSVFTTTLSSTAGLILATVALSGASTVANAGQGFKVIPRWTNS